MGKSRLDPRVAQNIRAMLDRVTVTGTREAEALIEARDALTRVIDAGEDGNEPADDRSERRA